MRYDSRLAMKLYAVTDRHWVGKQSFEEQIEDSLKGGITCLQLREKNVTKEAFESMASIISPLCHAYKVPFIINDDIDVAIKSKADGIHIGQKDQSLTEVRAIVGQDMMIGVSVQTLEQALEAERNGADYLGVGAVFSTSTKLDARVLSHDILRDICKTVKIPVVAIGGIKHDNISDLKNTHIAGIAVVSAVYGQDNIIHSTQALLKEVEAIL